MPIPIPILLVIGLVLTGCTSDRRLATDRAYPGLAPEDDFVTNLVLRGGLRMMNDSAWEGLDEQLSTGVAWDARHEGWPVAFAGAIDFHQADAEDSRGDDWESANWELSAGAQRTEILGGWYLSYGLGASYHRVILDGAAGYHSLDWAVGGYGQVGVGYLFDGWCIVGVTGRFSETSEMSFARADEDLGAGSSQILGQLGARF